jgi:hypothetical protein
MISGGLPLCSALRQVLLEELSLSRRIEIVLENLRSLRRMHCRPRAVDLIGEVSLN